MGRCHEFGLQISEGCNHEMLAGDNECTCAGCGIACGGQFAGCPDVWARGQPAVAKTEAGFGGPALLKRVSAGAPANGPAATPANGIAATWAPEPPLPPNEPFATVSLASGPAAVESEVAPATSPAEGEPADATPSTSSPISSDIGGELRAVAEGLKLQQSMLGELLTGLTRQQAMMAELLDSRHAELRLAMVAESLPEAVIEAVAKSWAANQEQLTEAAVALAKSIGLEGAVTKAIRQVEARADARFEEYCERQEKLVAKAVRAGARQAATAPAAPAKAPAKPAKPAAKKSAANAAKKRQPAKKVSRTSSQSTRPSRRSLGS
jgi:hypothetical protein